MLLSLYSSHPSVHGPDMLPVSIQHSTSEGDIVLCRYLNLFLSIGQLKHVYSSFLPGAALIWKSSFIIEMFYSITLHDKNIIFQFNTKVTHSVLPVFIGYPYPYLLQVGGLFCIGKLSAFVLVVSVTNYLSHCLSFLCGLSVGSAD